MSSLCIFRLQPLRRPLLRRPVSQISGAAQRRTLYAAGRMLARQQPTLLRLSARSQRPERPMAVVLSRGFASEPEITPVVMPALSPTMTHGTIAVWTKQPGDLCAPGDVLCEIETDKATVAFEVQDEYVLAKILEPQGKEVKVGELVALSVEDKAAFEAFKQLELTGKLNLPTAAPTAAAPAPAAEAPVAAAAAPAAAASSGVSLSEVLASLGDFALSPAARHHLSCHGVELKQGVNGTGKAGRITKGDVLLAIQNGLVVPKGSVAKKAPAAATAAKAAVASAPAPAPTAAPVTFTIPEVVVGEGQFKDTKTTNMRKVIARRLAESKATVPHAYQTVDCEIDAVLAFRKRLQKEYEVNVSVNDVIIRSAALALRDVPEANAFWDSKKSSAALNGSVDISVAVATPTGLITPIIKASDRKGLTGISSTMKDLAGRARQGKLKPEEFQGGSFTISNLGMFGIDEFSAVINPPQACIMAVGRGSKRVRAPAYKEGQDTKSLKPYVGTVMTATLSFDRRVIDEAIAGQFLQVFKAYVSKPERLLL